MATLMDERAAMSLFGPSKYDQLTREVHALRDLIKGLTQRIVHLDQEIVSLKTKVSKPRGRPPKPATMRKYK